MIYEWMFSIFHHRLHRLTQIFHLWDFFCVFVPLCSYKCRDAACSVWLLFSPRSFFFLEDVSLPSRGVGCVRVHQLNSSAWCVNQVDAYHTPPSLSQEGNRLHRPFRTAQVLPFQGELEGVCYASSSGFSSSSEASLAYFTRTLLKVSEASALARTVPGRKMILARLMRSVV